MIFSPQYYMCSQMTGKMRPRTQRRETCDSVFPVTSIKSRKKAAGAKHGKTYNQCQAREKESEKATSAKRRKTRNQC